ncbi:MAG TPA: DUF4430 domain-containing protein [Solirubrobacterales bacterium]|nr:DUF4430 domain-containing protein [Solirubrobacterales bacterium]
MRRSRGMAVAIALALCAALATAGCGFGAGDGVGEVSLTVTRDFGAERLAAPEAEAVAESDTVMRVLDRNLPIETGYGGAFVHSIDGLKGDRRDGRPYDWFFYVNGLWSSVGAADYPLRGGDSIWWDYRDWSASTRVSALVGAWPQPFADGYEGDRHPTAVECRGEAAVCSTVRSRLDDAGATLTRPGAKGAIRVLVGPWARLRDDPAVAALEDGPEASGVYADFVREDGAYGLRGLDEGGEPVRRLGPGAGLVAATRRFDAPPAWIVSGSSAAGVRAAAELLGTGGLKDRFAVAVDAGEEIPLPVPEDRR